MCHALLLLAKATDHKALQMPCWTFEFGNRHLQHAVRVGSLAVYNRKDDFSFTNICVCGRAGSLAASNSKPLPDPALVDVSI